jgi:hypothetical protein
VLSTENPECFQERSRWANSSVMASSSTKWLVNGHPISGYSTIVTLVLFLGGVQLISIGVLGEYLARIYTETKKRPVYVVREVGGIF